MIAGTIVPIVLALQQSAAATVNGGEACALTAAQVQRVRAAMLEHNTSCHYDNVTIGSVLQQRLVYAHKVVDDFS